MIYCTHRNYSTKRSPNDARDVVWALGEFFFFKFLFYYTNIAYLVVSSPLPPIQPPPPDVATSEPPPPRRRITQPQPHPTTHGHYHKGSKRCFRRLDPRTRDASASRVPWDRRWERRPNDASDASFGP